MWRTGWTLIKTRCANVKKWPLKFWFFPLGTYQQSKLSRQCAFEYTYPECPGRPDRALVLWVVPRRLEGQFHTVIYQIISRIFGWKDPFAPVSKYQILRWHKTWSHTKHNIDKFTSRWFTYCFLDMQGEKVINLPKKSSIFWSAQFFNHWANGKADGCYRLSFLFWFDLDRFFGVWFDSGSSCMAVVWIESAQLWVKRYAYCWKILSWLICFCS